MFPIVCATFRGLGVVPGEVEAAPEDWRGWYRLAHAYDLSGDRKRARSSMRHAIELANAADKT